MSPFAQPTDRVGGIQPQRAATVAPEAEQHSILQTIILHLLPGLLVLGICLATRPLVRSLGFPEDFADALFGMPIGVILLQLGYVLYQGKKRNGRLSLEGIVGYRERMPVWQYIIFALLLVGWNAVVYMPLVGVTKDLLTNVFYFWAPDWFLAEADLALYPKNIVLIMGLVGMGVFTIAGFVEEVYFRGYLLPRMGRLKGWAPILATALFTFYHFDILQNAAAIFVGFLPIAYVTYRKKNFWIAGIAHAVLNLISALLTYLPFLFV